MYYKFILSERAAPLSLLPSILVINFCDMAVESLRLAQLSALQF